MLTINDVMPLLSAQITLPGFPSTMLTLMYPTGVFVRSPANRYRGDRGRGGGYGSHGSGSTLGEGSSCLNPLRALRGHAVIMIAFFFAR